MAVLCIDTGTELRLLSYGDAEAILAAAEEAAARAEAAAAGLNLPEIQPGDAGKSLVVNDSEDGYELSARTFFYNDRAAFRASRIPDGVQYAIIAGYYAPGDDGAANFKLVTSEPNHAGKEQTADGKWWEIVRGAPIPVGCYGAKTDGTNASGSIEDALASAGRALLPLGVTIIGSPILIDNTVLAGDVQTAGGRVLCGHDARQSVIQSNSDVPGPVITVTFDEGTKAHTQMSFGKFSLFGFNLSDGIKIQNAAFLDWENTSIMGFGIGLTVDSVLSSKFSDMRFSWCSYGVSAIKSADGFSNPNALTWQQCVFSNNSEMGYSGGTAHANVSFLGGSFEGNGTDGKNGTGGCFINFDGGSQGAAGVNFDGVYFEGNKGDADLVLHNAGDNYVTVTIKGCNFNRLTGLPVTDANIFASGKIILNIIGCAFMADVETHAKAQKPYIVKDNNVLLNTVGCRYGNTIAAQGLDSQGSLGKYRGVIAADGSSLRLPKGWSSAKDSAGVYTITHNLNVPTLYDYSVMATSRTSGVKVERIVYGGNIFQVVCVNNSGVQSDAGFDFSMLHG